MANAAMLSPAHVVPCTTVERRLSLVATVYSFEALKFLNLVPRYNDFEVPSGLSYQIRDINLAMWELP